MNLKDMEQEMKEQEEEEEGKKEGKEGKVVHLLPASTPKIEPDSEWHRGEDGVWVPGPPPEEEEIVGSPSPFQEPRSTIHYPRTLPRDTYSGRDEEGFDRLVVVVDVDGIAKYMNQDKDGHLGAVEDDYPFWSRPSDSSPFD